MLLNPANDRKEQPGIGATAVIKNPGDDNYLVGAASDIDGTLKMTSDPGIYNIEFYFTGYCTLILKNVVLGTGGLYEGTVSLGAQGKDQKTFEVDFKKAIDEQ